MSALGRNLRLLRRELPQLLVRLQQITDLRAPRKCRHKLTVLLLTVLWSADAEFPVRTADPTASSTP
ncbi:MAG: hypothetical protein P8Y27_17870 [Chromatiaceae bacterium]|jgi:hypothetical protein